MVELSEQRLDYLTEAVSTSYGSASTDGSRKRRRSEGGAKGLSSMYQDDVLVGYRVRKTNVDGISMSKVFRFSRHLTSEIALQQATCFANSTDHNIGAPGSPTEADDEDPHDTADAVVDENEDDSDVDSSIVKDEDMHDETSSMAEGPTGDTEGHHDVTNASSPSSGSA